jgi:uncharacterized membrane-anchored protein
MKPVYRGVTVAVLQCLIVLSVAGKYALDRERLPRVWAKAAPVDPSLPIRGRYVSLRLQVEAPPDAGQWTTARLSAVGGRLVAMPDSAGTVHIMPAGAGRVAEAIAPQWVVAEPAAFFIPEHVPDPSRRAPGEELWVEVSVPAKGSPRPIRLGVKKNGVVTPLELR